MTKTVHNSYKSFEKALDKFILNFNTLGHDFGNQDRNSLKLFKLENKTINVKSFRIPNIINQIAYRFFRKSKAQRSYEYANKLIKLGIGTPQPIAYYELTTPFLFKKSYYISEQLECQLTYRELTTDLEYPDHENILRAFTRFTFELHEKRVHFLDHSPGNTLITKISNGYHFALVDLNRMEFKTLNFETRMKNFARLTKEQRLIKIMAHEYASISNLDENLVFNKMWLYTNQFQDSFLKKKRIKKKIKFWKS